MVVLTKRDLLAADTAVPALSAKDALHVWVISSASGQGIDELLEGLWSEVTTVRRREDAADDDADAEFWSSIDQP